jgi:hypothetical protein
MSHPGNGSGYKVAFFLTRAPALSPLGFRERWLASGEPAWPSGLYRYVHNSSIAGDAPIENAPPAPYDAVDEWVFDGREAARDWFASSAFRNEWLRDRECLLGKPLESLAGPVVEILGTDREASAEAIKILTLPVRRANMTTDAFAHHWLVVHAGLALAGPGTRDRLLQLISSPSDATVMPGLLQAPFDGLGIIEFASQADLDAEFSSEHYRNVMAPDEPRFTDPVRSRAMMVAETLVFSTS